MLNIGARLREERDRLGLSQAKFAEACGIKRTAQTTYESGERSPDARYLEAAGKIGVDIVYLLIGLRTSDEMIRALAAEVVLGHISRGIGIDPEKLHELLDEAADEERLVKHGQPSQRGATDIYRKALALLDEVNPPPGRIDVKLLAAVITKVESAVQGQKLSPAKRAGLVAVLYSAFKENGVIDQSMIDETVRISTPEH